jgi:hypothetical protein
MLISSSASFFLVDMVLSFVLPNYDMLHDDSWKGLPPAIVNFHGPVKKKLLLSNLIYDLLEYISPLILAMAK